MLESAHTPEGSQVHKCTSFCSAADTNPSAVAVVVVVIIQGTGKGGLAVVCLSPSNIGVWSNFNTFYTTAAEGYQKHLSRCRKTLAPMCLSLENRREDFRGGRCTYHIRGAYVKHPPSAHSRYGGKVKDDAMRCVFSSKLVVGTVLVSDIASQQRQSLSQIGSVSNLQKTLFYLSSVTITVYFF